MSFFEDELLCIISKDLFYNKVYTDYKKSKQPFEKGSKRLRKTNFKQAILKLRKK